MSLFAILVLLFFIGFGFVVAFVLLKVAWFFIKVALFGMLILFILAAMNRILSGG